MSVSRDNQISNNTITLSGTLSTPVTLTIPLNHLQRYFNIRLKTLLENKKIYLMQNFKNTIADDKSDREIAEISHNISSVIDSILLDSNNMSAEILGKVASQKKYGCTGSDINAIKLYNEYFTKIGLDSSNVRLVDSSGVSKNNLATSDFVSEFLLKNKDNEILKHMAHPGEGTLLNRMIPLKDNLKAKTGTLSDISSIAGYLITKNGRHVVFCILINNPSTTSSEKKALEDYIIREIYVRL